MNPMLLGALAGLAKSSLVDERRADKQRELAATTAMYSPWTGLAPMPVQEADPFGSIMQGMTAGALFSKYGPDATAADKAKKAKETPKVVSNPLYDTTSSVWEPVAYNYKPNNYNSGITG